MESKQSQLLKNKADKIEKLGAFKVNKTAKNSAEKNNKKEEQINAIATIINFKDGGVLFYAAREENQNKKKAVRNAFKNAKNQKLKVALVKANMNKPNLGDKILYFFGFKPRSEELTSVKMINSAGYTEKEKNSFNFNKNEKFNSSTGLRIMKFILNQKGLSDVNIAKIISKMCFKSTTAGKIGTILDGYSIVRSINSINKLSDEEKVKVDPEGRSYLDSIFFMEPEIADNYFNRFKEIAVYDNLYQKEAIGDGSVGYFGLKVAAKKMDAAVQAMDFGYDVLQFNKAWERGTKFAGKTIKFTLNAVSITLTVTGL